MKYRVYTRKIDDEYYLIEADRFEDTEWAVTFYRGDIPVGYIPVEAVEMICDDDEDKEGAE